MRHRLGLATMTQISVCKSSFPSAGTAVSLFRAKTTEYTTYKQSSHLTLNNIVTLKYGLEITQGH